MADFFLSEQQLFGAVFVPRYSLGRAGALRNEKLDLKLEPPFDTKKPWSFTDNAKCTAKLDDFELKVPTSCFLPMEKDGTRQLATLQSQLQQTEHQLQAARKRLLKTKGFIAAQWKDLEEKEEELKQNFIHFNEFVRDNEEKRIRAVKETAHRKESAELRQVEINKLLEEIEEMKHLMSLMEKRIQKYQIFKIFLQEVVEAGFEFENIPGIISRYLNLQEAKKQLSALYKQTMENCENADLDVMKLIEEKNFVIMGLNNQIANLQARYENANIKALESEELVTQIKNNSVKQLAEIDSVKNSIWNVYIHMATSKKHPIKIRKENVEEQMMYINRTLTELSKVNKLIKKRTSGKFSCKY